MTPPDLRRRFLCVTLALAVAAGCASNRSPWRAPAQPATAHHAEVRTLNDYQRARSQVLVRRIARPTRANLDWAAYHANFLIAEPPPEGNAAAVSAPARFDAASTFGGAIEAATLTGALGETPLTAEERAHPLALEPLAQWLSARDPKLGQALEELVSAVREEGWGLPPGPPVPRQSATEGFLHAAGTGVELWVKIEFAPWWRGFSALPDEDGDGSPQIYGRARAGVLSADAVALISGDYAGKTLDAREVQSWAHKLASYWYPSYNTDLVGAAARWPGDDTEADIKAELGALVLEAPAVVMRGKPQGKATYNVFVVDGAAAAPAAGRKKEKGTLVAGEKVKAPAARTTSPDVDPIARLIEGELAKTAGGSWEAWRDQVSPYHAIVRKHLRAVPAGIRALPGQDGFLFYRAALDYVVGGDLEKQPKKKNPVPVIVEWKKFLEQEGVDFLFVPVPTKAEIYPDKLDPAGAKLVGKVVNPSARKLLASLAAAGVEVVDLWTPFLAERPRAGAAEELFQRQDTHWTSRGLKLAAAAVAARVKRYPWYRSLAAKPRVYGERPAPFTRHGDLHSRLAEGEKKRHAPEALTGQQVLNPDGTPYDDDPDSPVVLLGDSFTGVYQLTDCEHAGVSAHLAKELGQPVDLVMSYGGGPNVRHKLMRRGVEGLAQKRLVIWMMTARDLWNYWEAWEPLAAKP